MHHFIWPLCHLKWSFAPFGVSALERIDSRVYLPVDRLPIVSVIVVVHIDFVTVAVATTAVVILLLLMFVCDGSGFYLVVFRVSSDAAFLLACV